MKILVLGSSGLVGTSLVRLLRSKKHDVTEWDILINKSHDLRIGCPYTDQFDFVFFLAYDIGGSKYLEEQKTAFIKNNMKIMINVFEELERSKVPFLYTSSQMDNMDNPYGTLKKIGNHYTSLLNGLIVRFWNVYGPEVIGIKSHVIPDFIDQFLKNGHIKLMTDGSEQRQFLHTEDCARALECCFLNYELFKKKCIIDITNFEWIKIVDLAATLTGTASMNMLSEKTDTVQTKHNEPDPFILKYWQPIISLKDGLKMIMDEMSEIPEF